MTRRLGLVVVLLALLGAPAAGAKTIKVDWREQKTLASGGQIQFRITKVVLTPTSWSVTATVTNAGDAALEFAPTGEPLRFDPGYPLWRNGLALIHSRRSSGKFGFTPHYEWLQAKPSFVQPAPPKVLAKGDAWTATFGGKAKLLKGVQYHVGFGVFVPRDVEAGGAHVYWITDHFATL